MYLNLVAGVVIIWFSNEQFLGRIVGSDVKFLIYNIIQCMWHWWVSKENQSANKNWTRKSHGSVTGGSILNCWPDTKRQLQTLAEMLQKKRPPLSNLIDVILLHVYIKSHVTLRHSMTQTTFMTPNVNILPYSFNNAPSHYHHL